MLISFREIPLIPPPDSDRKSDIFQPPRKPDTETTGWLAYRYWKNWSQTEVSNGHRRCETACDDYQDSAPHTADEACLSTESACGLGASVMYAGRGQ